MADLAIRAGLHIPERLLSWRFSRSGGPGGQSVNTSDSRAELRLDLAQLPEPFRTRALTRLSARLVDETVLAVIASQGSSQLRHPETPEGPVTENLRRANAAPPPP